MQVYTTRNYQIQDMVSNPIVNVEKFIFSGGEVHVKLHNVEPESSSATIVGNIKDANTLLETLLIKNALDEMFGWHNDPKRIDLFTPYLPYARQDRYCAPGEAFSLKVVAQLINSAKFNSVKVWDVHSDVALALIDNIKNIEQHQLVHNVVRNPENYVLVAPDGGALKKIYKVSQTLGIPYVVAEKVRNPENGEITSTRVNTEHIGEKDFLIVDDICDGGRTFVELGKALRPFTFGKVDLYVTHGIFSRGVDVFRDIIDSIYCPNMFDGLLIQNPIFQK